MPLPKDPIKRAMYLKKIKARNKRQWADPKFIQKHKEAMNRPETVEKLRKAILIQLSDPDKRNKMRANNRGTTGKKYSVETRAKMSAWQIGRKMSDEARKKMSIAKKGEQSVYIVGDTRFYSPRMRVGNYTWSRSVKERDNYTCQLCGEKFEAIDLHAHHIKEFASHPSLRIDVANGMTLCKNHHKLVHNAIRLI